MAQDPNPSLHVGIRCDALASLGTGHLVRQTAIVEELLGRGHRATLYGECDVEWARQQALGVGLTFVPPSDDPAGQFTGDGVDVVMIDGYPIPAAVGASCREAGIPVATMVDGEFGQHQPADLHVDQNLGSPEIDRPGWLVGPRYVLLRDVVRTRRGTPRPANEPPKVLVVFGGSDPFGGCAVAVELLLSTGLPMHVVAIAASDERRDELARLEAGPGQRVDAVGAQDDLPALAVTCDFAISAAGSTTWEFACLGIPTGLVCVVDNQRLGYEAATEGLAVGVGHLLELRDDESARDAARGLLARLATDASWRDELSERGLRLVDGDGRVRVVEALEELAGHRVPGL